MSQQQKVDYLKKWLISYGVSQKSVCIVIRIIMRLICDLGHRYLDYQSFILLFDYISIKDTAGLGNGIDPRTQKPLLIHQILSLADVAQEEYEYYTSKVKGYKLPIGLLNVVDDKNCNDTISQFRSNRSQCPSPLTPDQFLRTTQIYGLLNIYFTTVNNAPLDNNPDVVLTNRNGIDLQSAIPVQIGTNLSDPTQMDLFDTGINVLTSSATNWRRRISTLTYVNDLLSGGSNFITLDGTIVRADANLYALKKLDIVNITNIIDIIVAYQNAKKNMISIGADSSVTYVEGASNIVNPGDEFVIFSGRFDGTTSPPRPFQYMVVKVVGIDPTSSNNTDYYLLNLYRF